MAKEKQNEELEVKEVKQVKPDISKISFKINPQVLAEGYNVMGEGRAIKIVSIHNADRDIAGHLFIGTYNTKSRTWEDEDKGKVNSLTGLTDFEFRVLGIAKAIVVPKDMESLLLKV